MSAELPRAPIRCASRGSPPSRADTRTSRRATAGPSPASAQIRPPSPACAAAAERLRARSRRREPTPGSSDRCRTTAVSSPPSRLPPRSKSRRCRAPSVLKISVNATIKPAAPKLASRRNAYCQSLSHEKRFAPPRSISTLCHPPKQLYSGVAGNLMVHPHEDQRGRENSGAAHHHAAPSRRRELQNRERRHHRAQVKQPAPALPRAGSSPAAP